MTAHAILAVALIAVTVGACVWMIHLEREIRRKP